MGLFVVCFGFVVCCLLRCCFVVCFGIFVFACVFATINACLSCSVLFWLFFYDFLFFVCVRVFDCPFFVCVFACCFARFPFCRVLLTTMVWFLCVCLLGLVCVDMLVFVFCVLGFVDCCSVFCCV